MLVLFNYNIHKKTATLRLKVKAASKINRIEKFIFIANEYCLKITIKAVPEQGKANKEIIEFLSKEWNLKKEDLEIISGHKSKLKLLEIKNIALDYLNFLLNPYI